mmetsp:Transcript_30432/g.62686  ORF Transcript_30432/g.62686 Transcript_30432/m.62686 type:complete len:224 (+) Transcript_30432:708-1379(+)
MRLCPVKLHQSETSSPHVEHVLCHICGLSFPPIGGRRQLGIETQLVGHPKALNHSRHFVQNLCHRMTLTFKMFVEDVVHPKFNTPDEVSQDGVEIRNHGRDDDAEELFHHQSLQEGSEEKNPAIRIRQHAANPGVHKKPPIGVFTIAVLCKLILKEKEDIGVEAGNPVPDAAHARAVALAAEVIRRDTCAAEEKDGARDQNQLQEDGADDLHFRSSVLLDDVF